MRKEIIRKENLSTKKRNLLRFHPKMASKGFKGEKVGWAWARNVAVVGWCGCCIDGVKAHLGWDSPGGTAQIVIPEVDSCKVRKKSGQERSERSERMG